MRENKDRYNLKPLLNPMEHQHHQQNQQTSSDTNPIVDSSSIDISKLDGNQLLKDTFQPQTPNVTHTYKWKQF